ncbi:hypothetical protein [Streptosporangium sp. NPDC006007]|uniref:hypothetical protein n=1 Tax=Streptosporangium sp. NPDC006007 TaxID=3154575 RepID=UPI0033B88C02
MTPAEQLAADVARLDRLTPAELLLETGLAELAAAREQETPQDLAYRAELEKRAHTKETETDTICRRVGCPCCPTAAYCQSNAVASSTIRFPGARPATSRVCARCAEDLQDLQA